jgi:hypothetical protein
MPGSNSSHGTFDLQDDLRTAHHFDVDVDDGRPSRVPVRCCGCFCLSWARRWETGLRAADLAALERRQKALEWSMMPNHVGGPISDPTSMPSASVPSIADVAEWDGNRSEASSTYSLSRRTAPVPPNARVHPLERSLMIPAPAARH